MRKTGEPPTTGRLVDARLEKDLLNRPAQRQLLGSGIRRKDHMALLSGDTSDR
jgi:hypothetical protein